MMISEREELLEKVEFIKLQLCNLQKQMHFTSLSLVSEKLAPSQLELCKVMTSIYIEELPKMVQSVKDHPIYEQAEKDTYLLMLKFLVKENDEKTSTKNDNNN